MSKLDSLPEMIDDYQPALVCVVETHMQKEKEIQIPCYSLVYRNDRSANSGGILIGVRTYTNLPTFSFLPNKTQKIINLFMLCGNKRSYILKKTCR